MATLETTNVTATFEATRDEALDLTSEEVDIGRFAKVVYLEGGTGSSSTGTLTTGTTYSNPMCDPVTDDEP
ncbi:MAG TPA: hypothetical protein VGF91_30485 [Solirubrobacteraceae bacterium]